MVSLLTTLPFYTVQLNVQIWHCWYSDTRLKRHSALLASQKLVVFFSFLNLCCCCSSVPNERRRQDVIVHSPPAGGLIGQTGRNIQPGDWHRRLIMGCNRAPVWSTNQNATGPAWRTVTGIPSGYLGPAASHQWLGGEGGGAAIGAYHYVVVTRQHLQHSILFVWTRMDGFIVEPWWTVLPYFYKTCFEEQRVARWREIHCTIITWVFASNKTKHLIYRHPVAGPGPSDLIHLWIPPLSG